MKRKLRVAFKAPLNTLDSENQTCGCRANNPEICQNNGIPEICAFQREDGICKCPSKAWKKQYFKLKEEKLL